MRDMIAVEGSQIMMNAVALLPTGSGHADAGGDEHVGIATYHLLTGCYPEEADIEEDEDFDSHVFACVLAAAAMDGGSIVGQAGLTEGDLESLLEQRFPWIDISALIGFSQSSRTEDDEVAMVRHLLLAQRSTKGDVGRWLAAMVARRSVEPNHLWEDLGLRERSELSRLLARHFAPLAARNTKNMRWKRFFYRMLCEDDGFVMCTTPVCTQCNDFDLCFGEESGESRMAERRREFLLHTDSNSVAPQGPQDRSRP